DRLAAPGARGPGGHVQSRSGPIMRRGLPSPRPYAKGVGSDLLAIAIRITRCLEGYELFRRARVKSNGAVEIGLGGVHTHRYCNQLDHFCSARSKNVNAQ